MLVAPDQNRQYVESNPSVRRIKSDHLTAVASIFDIIGLTGCTLVTIGVVSNICSAPLLLVSASGVFGCYPVVLGCYYVFEDVALRERNNSGNSAKITPKIHKPRTAKQRKPTLSVKFDF